ncbi:MAG: hypothetical protein NC336_10330, partial [Clostridium sp.]|nr:hypothetical protein [Clostridium sp.]
ISEESEAPARQPLMKRISLNDKYRFRRDLFGGSDSDFRETLSLLESIGSLDEAMEYLTSDLCLDPEDDTVRDFAAVLALYYNS